MDLKDSKDLKDFTQPLPTSNTIFMDSQNIMFVILAVIILLSSIGTVVSKSIIRAATYLLFVLLGTAGLYFLMGYSFLGSVQIMVYAGGIIVLYVFSILLTSGQQEKLNRVYLMKKVAVGMSCIAGLAVFIAMFFKQQFLASVLTAPSESDASFLSIEKIGQQMLSTGENGYLLPFEAVSILLLACIVGGLIIARKR